MKLLTAASKTQRIEDTKRNKATVPWGRGFQREAPTALSGSQIKPPALPEVTDSDFRLLASNENKILVMLHIAVWMSLERNRA